MPRPGPASTFTPIYVPGATPIFEPGSSPPAAPPRREAPSIRGHTAAPPVSRAAERAPAAALRAPAADLGGASATLDIPPTPQSLMTVEDINGMNYARIDVPAVRERQAFVLTDPLCDLADRTNGKLTLDLSKVAAFSCAWINVLLIVAKRCKMKGGNLVLAGVSTQCAQMLKQMGLLKQFTIVKAAAATG